jgi:hypothetical protein
VFFAEQKCQDAMQVLRREVLCLDHGSMHFVSGQAVRAIPNLDCDPEVVSDTLPGSRQPPT